MAKTDLLPGGITEQKMAEWEAKYGKRNEVVFRGKIMSLRDPKKPLYFYFIKPGKTVVALAMQHVASKDLLKANDEFKNECLLHAEDELLNDELHKDEYANGIGKTIGEKFAFVEGEVEKI
jgi:hypothetical protein